MYQFSLPNQDGKIISLSDYFGKWVLVYFYPKDNTPGCTIEACTLSSNLPSFTNINAVVLGISTDSVESHKKFHTKFKLNFDLLSDIDKNVVNDFKVWGEKKFMGKSYQGTSRDSFLFNSKGELVKTYHNVKPLVHTAEVLNDLNQLHKSA